MSQHRLLFLMLAICCAGAGWWLFKPKDEPTTTRTASEVSEPAVFAGLDEVKQKEIWDAEHVTFEIETYLGRKLVEQLKNRSVEHLAGFYHADFSGVVPLRADSDTTEHASITQTTWTVDSSGSTSVDADGFSRALIESLSAVPEGGSGRFRVLQIARVPEEEAVDTWQLSVLLTFNGTSSAGEPIAYVSNGSMRVRFSSDDDIVSGQIIDSWHIDSESVRRGRQSLMEEATAQVGLDRLAIPDNWDCGKESVRQYRFQTAVEDFNSDGYLDIAVATADGQRFLLQWNPQTAQYEDVAASVGISTAFRSDNRAYLACWLDFDNDGDADLLLGESLYRNVEGKAFEPVADNGGLKIQFNPMGCVVADYDADGLLDLYILYQRDAAPARSEKPPAWVGDDNTGAVNQLWRNRGSGLFTETGRLAKATGGRRHSFAATWLYANEDHYPDLYIANDFARNSLLINQGDGSFEDVADESGVGDFATSMGVASGDINGDGTPEIYVANMYSKMGRRIIAQVSAEDYPDGIYEQLVGSCAGNRLYSTQGGDIRQFQELSEQLGVNAVGWAYAPAFADFDGDGLLDLYASTGFLSFNRQKPDG